MSTPILWIVFPAALTTVLWLVRRSGRLAFLLAVGVSAFLAALAIVLPEGVLRVGSLVISFPETLTVLGRRFVLSATDRPLVALIYSLGAFWFAGGLPARVRTDFPAFGMGIIAILVASLSVEPFLYAALLVEMAVLLSLPLLITPGVPPGQGLLRFLIFQTLGMPFILLAGWVLGSVEISPSREVLLGQAALLLGLGFAFWLAVFPFYSWVPLVTDEISPYLAGFILSLLPTFVLLLSLDFLNGLVWLRGNPALYNVLRLTGLVMIVTGGVWAAFQQNLNRIFGYAVIFETGIALLALSAQSVTGLRVFAYAFLPRLLTLGVWALALSALKSRAIQPELDRLKGKIAEAPFAAIALVIACFSLGGLPLLASFPVRLGVMAELARFSPIYPLLVLLGSTGFLFSGFRLMMVLVGGERRAWLSVESRSQQLFLAGGSLALLLLGWFPRAALGLLEQLLRAFPNLP